MPKLNPFQASKKKGGADKKLTAQIIRNAPEVKIEKPKSAKGQFTEPETSSLPPIKPKGEEAHTEVKEEKKVEAKESSGIPKLTVDVIRKRYLYPFSVDSNEILLILNSGEIKGVGKEHGFGEYNCTSTATGLHSIKR
jgi:hypothetical protein